MVAGGQDKNWNIHSITEIYSVEDGSWRVGTPLPEANAGMASLPYGDSFLVLGGKADFCSNKIYKVCNLSRFQTIICISKFVNTNLISLFQFDPSTRNGSWTELDTKLRRSNRNFVAMYVDSSMFQSPECGTGKMF